ncbi:hypothetical protein HYH02_011518 [Chlamydomonas schloesseri]|uniref:Uncharacterized protein n=1 Tax=Chlamydomonas schloesseri TaxID=2026947 RepID=A0A835TE71_9CHLO|nr:hypothetical protein HYH02_011518 [Chlamydomonas schloesseri]|eukprot:KAG2436581.1 hypothetical protein HYH02_011518 [Chlamydomonas schloesseri]
MPALVSVTSRIGAQARTAAPSKASVRVPVTIARADPKFTLENSRNSAEGYVEKDTAGQSNMYPTVMKPFEAGSASDTVQQDNFNNGLAVGASVAALGAIALGLTALLNAGGAAPVADEEDYSTYGSLSSYATKFSPRAAAPAPAPAAVEAPAVAAE